MKGIRVGLAGCGWGIVLGAVVAVVLYGPSGEFGGAVAMVLIGGVIGGAVGAVLGCPVALVTAALTYQEPRRAARVAVFVFCLAGFAFMGAWLAAMEPSGRDGVIVPAAVLTGLLLIAAARVHRTVRLEIAHEGFWR